MIRPSLRLRLPKPNPDAVRWRQNDIRRQLSPAVLPVLAHSLEPLQYPHNRVTYTGGEHQKHALLILLIDFREGGRRGGERLYPFRSVQTAARCRSSARR